MCACVTHTHEHDTQKHENFVCAHEITHEKHEIFVCAHEITHEKHEIFVCAHEITHEKHEIFRVCTQFHTRNTKISCMRFFKKMSEHLKKWIKIKVSISSGYWNHFHRFVSVNTAFFNYFV